MISTIYYNDIAEHRVSSGGYTFKFIYCIGIRKIFLQLLVVWFGEILNTLSNFQQCAVMSTFQVVNRIFPSEIYGVRTHTMHATTS